MEKTPSTCCNCNASKAKSNTQMSTLNIVSAIVFFLFPKCPICWAAYASFFSYIGLGQLEYNSYWRYVIMSVFLVGSVYLLWRHYQNKSWLSILLYGSGLTILLLSYFLNYNQIGWLLLVALLFMLSNFQRIKKVNQLV